MFFFFFIHACIFVYLLLRVVLPLRSPMSVKVALTLLFLLVSQHNLVRRAFGQMSTPEISGSVITLEGFCFAALLFFFLLVLADDLYGLIRAGIGLVRKKRQKARYFSPGRRKAMLGVAAVIPAAWGVSEAVMVPRVKRMEEKSPKVPGELDGLNIVHIADLHISPLFDQNWASSLVERINGLSPDLILITGDLVDGTPGTRSKAIAPLAALNARYGVYGCMGNHEYYGDFRGWQKAFPRLGLTMLENRHELITVGGRQIAIGGITDEVAERFGLPLPDPRAVFKGAPSNAFKIMLSHRPTEAPRCAKAGADVQLSGHTHGGQILGMNRVVSRFNNGFVYGWYTVDDMRLYVTSGAGLWNGFPVRLGVPSEIAHIVLRAI